MSLGAIGATALLVSAAQLAAQSTASLPIDATVLPRHRLGIRVLTGFARFDELLGNGGTRNLAASFATDSFTAKQLPQLENTQTAIRTLAATPAFSVTAGNIVAAANSRIVTAPLMLEYGLTSRLSLGVVIPLVETRSTVFGQLNPRAGAANVGANPANASSWATNAQLVTSLRNAATALQTRLSSCTTNPAGAGCAALLAQQQNAQALIDATSPFAAALATLYGTSSSTPGTFFVPINNSPTQTAINARIASLRQSYQSFGGSVVDATPVGAPGPAARADLQNLLARAGYDSLASRDRSSIGDITVGAAYQLANTFADSARLATGGILYRVAVNGAFRFGTGEPAARNKLFDNATGYGQPGIIVGGAADLRLRPRVFLTTLASHTRQLGSVDVPRIANTWNAVFPLTLPLGGTYSAGDLTSLTLVPRYRLAGLFTIDGLYSLTHAGADKYTGVVPSVLPTDPTNPPIATLGGTTTPAGMAAATAHQVGIGFTYSSSFSDRNPGRLPYEASFRHTETIAGSGGPVAKVFVEQIQLRVFFR